MKHSEMLNLNLPEDNDLINVGHLSGNFEKIDSAFQILPIKQEESKTDIDVMACPPYWTMYNPTDEDIVYIDHNFFDEEFTLEAGQTITHEIEEPVNIRISSEVTIDYVWFIPASEAFSGGGGGGTSDYNKLNNLPTINNVEIKNNKTADDLGLVAKENGKGLSTNDFSNSYKSQLDGLDDALDAKLNANSVGVAGGVAELGSDGKVPSSQLPDPVAQKEYRIAEEASTSYAKVYKLQQKSGETWSDISDSASINIPKDMVVESGSVKECTTDNVPVSGYKKGDKYIDLVIANKADAHIYINVKDLINNEASGIKYSNSESSLTATNVQGAIDEIARTLKNTIESPNVGEVGQVLAVKTVDASGKPTSWECITGGGGTTYESKEAVSGGEDVSLCTTGEKYIWNNKYNKPSTGVPKTDLASSVQTSLGLADTALQSYTEKYTGTVTKVKVGSSGTEYSPSSGVVTIPAYPTSLPANGGTAANVSGTVAVANGGTGATTAANARTNLGLGGAAVKSVDTSFTGSSTSTNLPTTAAVVAALKNEYGIYPCFSASNTTLASGSFLAIGNRIHINCVVAFSKYALSPYYQICKLPFKVKSPAGSGNRYISPDGWYVDDGDDIIYTSNQFPKGSTLSLNVVFTRYNSVMS